MTAVNEICVTETEINGTAAVKITGLLRYSLYKTFDCGQCFRFEPSRVYEDAFEGVAYGRFLRVYQETPDDMTMLGITKDEFYSIWFRFFSLHRDWQKIEADIASRSPQLAKAGELAGDIRILTQEPFEAIVSFIISQCNNIPRIKGLVKALCEKYGEPILSPEKKTLYTFPTPEKILALPLSSLTALKVGYRDKYIYAAAKAASEGIIDEIKAAPSLEEAKKIIMKIEGVGDKVASCALLFGFEHYGAFPRDVWIKRAMKRLFPDCRDFSVFGQYAGVAQQYLFYCERYLEGK